MKILTVNAGSSSLKFNVIELPEEKELISGYFERIGLGESFYNIKIDGTKIKTEVNLENHTDAIKHLVDELFKNNVIASLDEIDGVGHRVVHGGSTYSSSVVVDDDVISNIEDCSVLAPLHNPANLTGIKSFMEQMPNTKNVVVFDTAFHQTMPEENYLYSVPMEWYKEYGIRKYGFHGTSHKYITETMKEMLGKENINIISCHIGSGASICCIKDSKSYDTTMGFTPNAGVTMGTRCGDVDYSVIPYYMDQTNSDIKTVDNILNKKSGLLGLSGISSDCRDIEAAIEDGNKDAILAFNIFVDKIVDYIAKYYVKLSGNVDAIVFTAGVGENGRNIRAEVMNKLACLGITISDDNEKIASYLDIKEGLISGDDSKVKVYVVPTDEELMIAKETFDLIK